MQEKNIQWHPAFIAAMRLELSEDEGQLDFRSEYNLNTKPLEIDLLVIRKQKDVELQNEIGKFFRGHNLMEYKSPGDGMGIDVFYKVLGYACLYKSYGEKENLIEADDITVSLVREAEPIALLSYFREQGIEYEKQRDGIYRIEKGVPFPTQIIVIKKLKQKDHVWLKSLSKTLNVKQLSELVHNSMKLTKKNEKELADSILQVSMQANQDIAKVLKGSGDMCEALMELMKPEIQEIEKQGEARGEARGRSEGISIGEARGIIRMMLKRKYPYEDILEELMEQMNITQEKAEEYLNNYLEENRISL